MASCVLGNQCRGAQDRHAVKFVDGLEPSSTKMIRDWKVGERGKRGGPIKNG